MATRGACFDCDEYPDLGTYANCSAWHGDCTLPVGSHPSNDGACVRFRQPDGFTMENQQWVFLAAVVIFTLIASVTDIRTRKLPNWLTVPAFACGLLFHLVTGGLLGLGQSVAGFAVGFGVLLILWLIGGGGGGDVKLMGALGAWLGPIPILIVIGLSVLFALAGTAGMAGRDLVAHGYLRVRRRYMPAIASSTRGGRVLSDEELARNRQKRRVLPYALPVALATWSLLAWKFVVIPS